MADEEHRSSMFDVADGICRILDERLIVGVVREDDMPEEQRDETPHPFAEAVSWPDSQFLAPSLGKLGVARELLACMQ
jgi:hypothetical protein